MGKASVHHSISPRPSVALHLSTPYPRRYIQCHLTVASPAHKARSLSANSRYIPAVHPPRGAQPSSTDASGAGTTLPPLTSRQSTTAENGKPRSDSLGGLANSRAARNPTVAGTLRGPAAGHSRAERPLEVRRPQRGRRDPVNKPRVQVTPRGPRPFCSC